MASKLTLIRRLAVQQARAQLYEVPSHQLVEIPGQPNVVYELRDYSGNVEDGAGRARHELPFLFKPFEVGQRPPPKEDSLEASMPREATIHEYLDWTVTARPVVREENLDFSGFRVICLLPRLRPNWPAPNAYEKEVPKACEGLGAPKNPLPCLLTNAKAVCSATIRCGKGYLEIPFFATKESRRGQGFGRCLLDAIEAVARSVSVSRLLLCSTDDEKTVSTWKHLGFQVTNPDELESWGICSGDLLHMTNTIQMVKQLEEPKSWRALLIRHEHFVQRTYYSDDPPVAWKALKRKRGSPASHCEQDELPQEGYVNAQENTCGERGKEHKPRENGVVVSPMLTENVEENEPYVSRESHTDPCMPCVSGNDVNEAKEMEPEYQEQGSWRANGTEQAPTIDASCCVEMCRSDVGNFNQNQYRRAQHFAGQQPGIIRMVSVCNRIEYNGVGGQNEGMVERACIAADPD